MSDSYLLFVEGSDDEHVFYNLLEHYQVPEQFSIKNKGGISNLLKTLPTELRLNSELERLGIVVDADASLNDRWRALQNILNKAGTVQSLPDAPDPNGTIINLERPDRILTVGVWIMPNNQRPGMLEDFVSFLVPTDDSLWNRAADCIDQIPQQNRFFPPDHHIKAHLHTWLAWQKEPGKPMGQAIKSYLNPDVSPAQELIAWLRRLFDV